MVKVVNGEVDLKCLELRDIIDVKLLQQFLDNFAIGMNCAAVSVDREGKEVTKPSFYRPFCENYIHKSEIGDARCAICHNDMGQAAAKQMKPYIGECHAGLIDFAAPVIIKGELLGTVLGGQVLDQEPKEAKIRTVAREIKSYEDELWAASQKIDIVPEKNIKAAAEVLFVVVNAFAQNGYNRIETEILTSTLTENFLQISATVEQLAASAQTITDSQDSLSSEIHAIEETANEVASIAQTISKVADKTNMIGLNASIEAARLGNDGRSFTVVAMEIRNLAEITKQTAAHIGNLNKSINEKVGVTITKSNETMNTTQDQSAAMEELSATVQDMVGTAERLKKLFEYKD